MNIRPETAEVIYTILVRVCGANPTMRENFVAHFTDGLHERGEWRFSGKLAFGGKFWWNSHGDPFYVNYYNEDQTDERDAIVKEANEQLAQLKIVGAEVFQSMWDKREAMDALDHAILDRIDKIAREHEFTRVEILAYSDKCYKGRWEKPMPPEIKQLLDLWLEEIHANGFEAIWTRKKGWG